MIHRPGRWSRVVLTLAVILILSLGFALSPARGMGDAAPQPGPIGAQAAAQSTPIVRMMIFHSESCPSCQTIVDQFLPSLQSQYGAQVCMILFEISDPANMQVLVALERAYGVPSDRATIPEVFVGNDVFLGADAIQQELRETIDEYLSQGGVDLTPPMQEILAARQPVGGGPVNAVMFYMSTCGHCHEVIENLLPILKGRYGDQFQIKLINVDSEEHYDLFLTYIRTLSGDAELRGVPIMVIGAGIMLGTFDIGTNAEGWIQQYLAQGGVDYPPGLFSMLDGPLYELEGASPAPTRTSSPATQVPTEGPRPNLGAPTINMAYFFQAGCQECDRVQLTLDAIKATYPQLEIERFPIVGNELLNEALGKKAGVPEVKRLVAPSLFVGTGALVDDEINSANIEALLGPYVSTGAPRIWEDIDTEDPTAGVTKRFDSLGVLTVVGAGLIDGLNPCAFATLVFFISYLALSGRKGREVLAVGIAFTLGVFLTYLGVGLGLSKVLARFDFLARLGRWVYGLTAVLCGVLAVLSFADYLKARKGQAEDMALSLPTALRKRINAVIRRGQTARAFVPIAFVTGAAVSIIELACTGQVYLPTIIFVLSDPDRQVKAFLYLLLYNLAFILPLIVVFALAYMGTTGSQLGIFLKRHVANIKLATAILFLALTAWLISSLL